MGQSVHWTRRLGRECVYMAAASMVVVAAYRLGSALLKPEDYGYIGEVRAALATRPLLAVGSPLTVRNTSQPTATYSLVLFTSPACHFCVDSAAFHRLLQQEARKNSRPFHIAVPRVDRARAYLRSAGLDASSARSWEDLSARAYGTPTIVLIDPGGMVLRTWLGALDKEGEAELLQAVRSPASVQRLARRMPSGELVLTLSECRALAEERRTQVVSTLEREDFDQGHLDGALNLPLGELRVRAPLELDRRALQLVDCSVLPDPVCSQAVEVLRSLNFEAAAVGSG